MLFHFWWRGFVSHVLFWDVSILLPSPLPSSFHFILACRLRFPDQPKKITVPNFSWNNMITSALVRLTFFHFYLFFVSLNLCLGLFNLSLQVFLGTFIQQTLLLCPRFLLESYLTFHISLLCPWAEDKHANAKSVKFLSSLVIAAYMFGVTAWSLSFAWDKFNLAIGYCCWQMFFSGAHIATGPFRSMDIPLLFFSSSQFSYTFCLYNYPFIWFPIISFI